MITLDSLRFLQSDVGAELLSTLKNADLSDANTLKLLTDLRKRYSPENAAAALETARLRIKAREKLIGDTDQLFLTREALEQASNGAVSKLRAQWFKDYERIADLGCSIGGDTVEFSQQSEVVGLDRDPVRLAMAQANVCPVARYPVQFVRANLQNKLPFAGIAAAFFDPARRTEGKRIFSVKDYSPPLEIIRDWHFDSLMVKLSPGVDLAELSPYGGSVIFASVNGELKEAQLCLGRLNRGHPMAQVITMRLPSNLQFELLESQNIPAPPLREPRGYLYEPDPAIIRAGLLGELAERLQLEMYRLDETIAYLTADHLIETPLARTWVIEDWMPFNLKTLRAYLRERNVGRVTVKKRGSPIMPEELIAKLKLSGEGEEKVVVLTHVAGQPAILICRTT